jgi:hypothetical protein
MRHWQLFGKNWGRTGYILAIAFNKIYGGRNDDGAYAVQQTSDGGYIRAGLISFRAGLTIS